MLPTDNSNNKKKTLTSLFFILLLLLFFVYLIKPISADDPCSPTSCTRTGPLIRFPFRLRNRQPAHCGFPGFDLSCNKKNQTLLNLPSSSRSFIVKSISYASQVINIDPDFCSLEGLRRGINLTGTPYDYSIVDKYTFYNCSLQNKEFMFQTVPMIPFPCLGRLNYSVFAVRTLWIPFGDIPESCEDIRTIEVPTSRRFVDIRNQLTLMWFAPFCRPCELDGRTCGLKDDGQTVCFGPSDHGIPRSAKYGLSIGIGVPALVCIIGLVCYVCKARNHNRGQRHNIDLFSIAITPQPPSTTGLDGPTIESYPKTILGESCRLPKDDDDTCAICLSDYQPKEAVRSIPECNHYFHADCIDEWLKLNATCPVCRKSPESSSLVTPCSSMSSNSSQTTTEV